MRGFFTILAVTSLFALSLGIKPVFADTCTIMYGGGETDCKITPTPAPTQSNSTQTTKGGLTVQKPSNTIKTPATGPEAIGLISLIPAAAAGFYLRKKA